MDSEDLVLVEDPPMRLISSPPESSSPTIPSNGSALKDGFRDSTSFPPAIPTSAEVFSLCAPSLRPKVEFAPYPRIPCSMTTVEDCCHAHSGNSCMTKQKLKNEICNVSDMTLMSGAPEPWSYSKRSLKPKKSSDPPPPPPPPPPFSPPPPPQPATVVLPPPPPPPPPAPIVAPVGLASDPFFGVHSYETYEDVSKPADLISAHYSGESVPDTGRIVRILPFKRAVFTTMHRAHKADFDEFSWIFQYGCTDFWYPKPQPSFLRRMQGFGLGCEPEDLPYLDNARPVSLETPKIWATATLTTPTDDDIFDCDAGHTVETDFSGACPECTDEKSEALDSTDLTYYIVLSTCQANDPFIHGAHFNGKQIYKLVKCGSREAAIAEVYYAAGVNGWSVAFSCVMRSDETFEKRHGTIKPVDELWMLSEEEEDENVVRVFF